MEVISGILTLRQIIVGVILGVSCWCTASSARQLASISAKVDPRLLCRINIPAQDMYVGELVEHLAEQTGINIASEDGEQAGDAPLFIRIKSLSASDVMDALQSELSLKGADWRWEVSRNAGGHLQYILVRSRESRDMPATVLAMVRQKFVEEAELLTALAQLDPKDRSKHLADLSKALLQADDTSAKAILNEERTMQAYKVFGMLPADVRTKILTGNASVTIPVSELNPEGQTWVTDQWKFATSAGGLTLGPRRAMIPIPMPKTAQISTQTDRRCVAPLLFMGLDTIGGIAYAGGNPTESGLRRLLYSRWLQPGDRIDDAADAIQYTPVPKAGAYEVHHAWRDPLNTMADAAAVSIIARLAPESNGSTYGALYSNRLYTVKETLDTLADEGRGILHKWRDHILLADDFTWITMGTGTPPWAVMKPLLQAIRDGHGLPSGRALAAAAAALSPAQAHNLPDPLFALAGVTLLHEIAERSDLTPAAATRMALSYNGIKLTPDVAAWLAKQPPVQKTIAGEVPDRMYAQTREVRDGPNPYSGVSLFVVTQSGRKQIVGNAVVTPMQANMKPEVATFRPAHGPTAPGIVDK